MPDVSSGPRATLVLAVGSAVAIGVCAGALASRSCGKDSSCSKPESSSSTPSSGSENVEWSVSKAFMNRLSESLLERLGAKRSALHGFANRRHEIKLNEKGAKGQVSTTRLWMQMLVLELPSSVPETPTPAAGAAKKNNAKNVKPTVEQYVNTTKSAASGGATSAASASGTWIHVLHELLTDAGLPHVLYDSVQNYRRVGLLVWSEDPSFFSVLLRPLLDKLSLTLITCMFGKTYSNGHEEDLPFALLQKPVKVAMAPESRFAIWYPLRRSGKFYLESPEDRCAMLLDHAVIGRSYGEQNLAHDVRLQATGLDESDNEFVIGIIGRELHPLSKVIEDMRRTRHTSEFMDSLGPFFVGCKRYQFPESSQVAGELTDRITAKLSLLGGGKACESAF